MHRFDFACGASRAAEGGTGRSAPCAHPPCEEEHTRKPAARLSLITRHYLLATALGLHVQKA